MFPFILSAGLMTLFALFLLLPGLWHQSASLDEENVIQDEANVRITREQLEQLKASFAEGQISQTEFDTHRKELETALAKSLASTARVKTQGNGRFAAIALGVLLPVSAGYLYYSLGKPEMLDESFVLASQQQAAAAGTGEKLPSIDELVPSLVEHLEKNPNDAKGWRLLGRTYRSLQQFEKSLTALSKAFEIDGTNPGLMLELADVKAVLNNGQLAGEPLSLVERALRLNPADVQGNWMLGMAYQQQGRAADAIAVWEPLLSALENAPQSQAQLRQIIDETRASIGEKSDPNGIAATTTPEPSTDASVLVQVVLDPALTVNLPPDASVFVYAKATAGPPMPLAAMKSQVRDLPLEVRLDDSLAMMPALKLSGFERVTVGARVSLSGDPVASDGDVFGEVANVEVGEIAPVVISLSQIVKTDEDATDN